MRGSKKTAEATTPATEIKEAKVLRAHEFENGNVSFNMEVNGIQIYNCMYLEGTTKDGKEYEMIAFPQTKGKDGKYYNNVWFPISDELKDNIVKQLSDLV